MFLNVNRPMTMGALAQLYDGNPNISPEKVDYGMTGQQREYVNRQASNLGIEDPAQFFERRRTSAALAATPSGGEIEAARQLGALPGQVAESRRMAMWDTVSAAKEAEASNLATLQQRNAARRFPVVPGQAPVLSPLEQSEAMRLGQTPDQFATSQRLGVNRSVPGVGDLSRSGSAHPDELYRDPRFQAIIQSQPDKAGQIFSALTGHPDLGGYMKGQMAQQRDRVGTGVDYFKKGFQDGMFKIDAQGNVMQRQRVADPLTGKLALGADYGPLDEYSKGLWAEGSVKSGVMGDEQIRLAHYMSRKAAEDAAQNQQAEQSLATTQAGEANGVPPVFQTAGFARVQKKNPALAKQLWEDWQRTRFQQGNTGPSPLFPSVTGSGYSLEGP